MQLLELQATLSSPSVCFDPEQGLLHMKGESYPENTFEFFSPLISWIDSYIQSSSSPVRLELELAYLNTGSVKCLMDIFDMFEDAHVDGRDVGVVWRYNQKNTRALETAEEFSEDLSFPFMIEAI